MYKILGNPVLKNIFVENVDNYIVNYSNRNCYNLLSRIITIAV